MSSFVVGETIVQEWTVLDGSQNPLTGIVRPPGAGDGTGTQIALYLHRQSGSTMVAATEVITWLEIGTTGHYYLSFAPQNLGLYVLQLKEIDAASLQRTYRFPDMGVMAAGSVFAPTFANSFCAQSDVERWSQLTFSSVSKPTSVQLAGFAETRASEMISVLAGAGFPVLPTTVEPNSVEEDLLREANAVSTAADAIVVRFMQESPSRTEKAVGLLEEYDRRMERIEAYVRRKLADTAMRTHVSSGALTLKDEGSTDDDDSMGIGMADKF